MRQFARDSDRRLRRTEGPPKPALPADSPIERAVRADHSIERAAAAEDPVERSEGDALKASETRLATRPRLGAFLTNEAWARSMVGCPYVALAGDALKRLPLNHRAGFVLSLMDGSIDLETVIELCAMQRDDALTLVRDLFESDVVRFR